MLIRPSALLNTSLKELPQLSSTLLLRPPRGAMTSFTPAAPRTRLLAAVHASPQHRAFSSSSPPTPEKEHKNHNTQQLTSSPEVERAAADAAQSVRNAVSQGAPAWKWRSFLPQHCYPGLDVASQVDLNLHHQPRDLSDRFARVVVKCLRWPTDLFFSRRYVHRATMIETIAAVPGMVGGMLLHLRSLRRFEESHGWIRALLEEAENERMHLMTFMAISQPKLWERAVVMTVQFIFAPLYALVFVISPKTAHRIVGQLEEEAIHSYTEFLNDIEAGKIENIPAPEIAKAYWCLPPDAKLREVVIAVRADEAGHRDVNHYRANLLATGRSDAPAPLGPHPHVPPEELK